MQEEDFVPDSACVGCLHQYEGQHISCPAKDEELTIDEATMTITACPHFSDKVGRIWWPSESEEDDIIRSAESGM